MTKMMVVIMRWWWRWSDNFNVVEDENHKDYGDEMMIKVRTLMTVMVRIMTVMLYCNDNVDEMMQWPDDIEGSNDGDEDYHAVDDVDDVDGNEKMIKWRW